MVISLPVAVSSEGNISGMTGASTAPKSARKAWRRVAVMALAFPATRKPSHEREARAAPFLRHDLDD
jgi:hypothetical protein